MTEYKFNVSNAILGDDHEFNRLLEYLNKLEDGSWGYRTGYLYFFNEQDAVMFSLLYQL